MAELADILAQVPLFSKLSKRDRSRLADRMSDRTWNEGDVVIEEGHGGAGFWLIQAGNATVSIAGEVIRGLGPGEWFGEIAIIDEGPRSATVTAATDLRCRGIVAWEFVPFVKENPDVAWALLQGLATRLRETQAR
jgi:CRP/FNR family transcriptional regulator, cyclic AMP receptor protein